MHMFFRFLEANHELDIFYTCYFSVIWYFSRIFAFVILMKQKQCVTSGNLGFSEKEALFNLYSPSANLLDTNATNFIKMSPSIDFFHIFGVSFSTE